LDRRFQRGLRQFHLLDLLLQGATIPLFHDSLGLYNRRWLVLQLEDLVCKLPDDDSEALVLLKYRLLNYLFLLGLLRE
jgi:hypothetical protein